MRNNRQTGQWRAEETAGGMPFRRGHPFNVTLIVNNNGYKVRSISTVLTSAVPPVLPL